MKSNKAWQVLMGSGLLLAAVVITRLQNRVLSLEEREIYNVRQVVSAWASHANRLNALERRSERKPGMLPGVLEVK